MTHLLKVGRFLLFFMESAILTHNIQNCPRCDHKNDSYDWDFQQPKIRMECIVCGQHWSANGKNALAVRAASGTSVVEEIRIENPNWRQEYLGRYAPAVFSKSAITSGVFDKSKQFQKIEKDFEPTKNYMFPVHILSLGVMFLALVTAPQFRSLFEPSKAEILETNNVDFITTAAVEAEESSFAISTVKLMKIVRGKNKFINIKATARNVSGDVIEQPKFNIFMKNANGATVQDFSMRSNKKNVKPGETIRINSEILDETNSTKTVSIAFQK